MVKLSAIAKSLKKDGKFIYGVGLLAGLMSSALSSVRGMDFRIADPPTKEPAKYIPTPTLKQGHSKGSSRNVL